MKKVAYFPLLGFAFFLFACEKTPPPAQQNYCYTCGGVSGPYSPDPSYRYGHIETVGSENWDYWSLALGDTTGHIETVGSENWDYWHFNLAATNGYIETIGSENWDYWKLTSGGRSIYIETVGSENWDYWHITESSTGFSAYMETAGSNNFDNWHLYINSSSVLSIETSGSENWDNWNFGTYSLHGMDLEQWAAVLFIPVYVSAIHQQGIDL